jgi:hypothetical protein
MYDMLRGLYQRRVAPPRNERFENREKLEKNLVDDDHPYPRKAVSCFSSVELH